MMGTPTTIGSFDDSPAGAGVSDALLAMDAGDLAQSWRRCSLTADFLARYYSYYFPYREKAKDSISREAAENSISYILNELVENTAKYSDARDARVRVAVHLRESDILFVVSNHVSEGRAGELLRIARDLMGGNPEELYMQQLEKETDASGLGYLTMINDYGAVLGFKLEKSDDEAYEGTVQVSMRWKEA